ncbi:hypothetical protein N9M20_05020 [Gammaproteobacteria bacterium]|nr:hypothetical protein [Gammaproteobacteria bacterium]
MPAYSYSAIDPNGLKKKGLLSAQSEREARKLIKELNLTPINVSETNGNLSRISRVKNKRYCHNNSADGYIARS